MDAWYVHLQSISLISTDDPPTDALFCDFTVSNETGHALYTMHNLELALHGNNVPKPARRFELVPQLMSDLGPIEDKEATPAPKILEYTRGAEMKIQQFILSLDPLEPYRFWFASSSGLDGDAALGFTRSLRREFPVWTVRVAVFDQSWSSTERNQFVGVLDSKETCEDELYVSSTGDVTVPRIVTSSPPRTRVEFSPSLPWTYDGRHFLQSVNTSIPQGHVHVHVDLASTPTETIWSFVGRLEGSDQRVAGLSMGPLSNSVAIHPTALFALPEDYGALHPDFFAHVIAVHATGIRAFEVPSRLHGHSVLVTHTEESIVASLSAIFKHYGATLSSTVTEPDILDIKACCASKFDTIIVGPGATLYAREALRGALQPHGRICLWADAETGVPSLLKRDSWAIGDALQYAVRNGETQSNLAPPLTVIGQPPPQEVEFTSAPFDANKSYLLIGGIGSLGMEIALWMYRVCSPHSLTYLR